MHDISLQSSAGRRFSCNIIPYFCRKLGKMSQNLSSAAIVIVALRVKYSFSFQNKVYINIEDAIQVNSFEII